MAKQVSTTKKAYNNMMQMLSPYGKNELCHLMGLGYAGFLDDNCELKIPCPVLLILGEKDKTGKVAQYNKAWTRQTEYPLKIINDAAHNVNVDKPEEVNDCIRAFLSDITRETRESASAPTPGNFSKTEHLLQNITVILIELPSCSLMLR